MLPLLYLLNYEFKLSAFILLQAATDRAPSIEPA